MSEDNTYRPVRDRRDQPWYWKNNALYNFVQMPDGNVVNFSIILGSSAMSVYDLLTRMADEETQSCFPSVKTLAYWLGIGDTTISDSIALLRYHGLIEPQHRASLEGDLESNMYVLLPVVDWKLLGGNGDLPERLKEPLQKRWDAALKRKRPESLKRALKDGRIARYLTRGGLNSGVGVGQILKGGGLKFEDKVHLTVQASKEQTSNNNSEKNVAPLAVVDFETSKNGIAVVLESRVANVIEILRSYKLAAKTIAIAARSNIEHAEYVAREFSLEAEAEAKFWTGRKGSVQGALRLRLENTSWQSSRDIERQEHEAQQAIEIARREREAQQKAAARATEKAQREARTLEQKIFVSNTMSEFERLTAQKQAGVYAEIMKRDAFAVARAPGGDLRRIEPDSPLWISLVQSIGAVLQEWKTRQPELPALEQRAAGEYDDEIEMPSAPPSLAPMPETEGFGTAASSPTLARLMAKRDAPKAPATPELDAELRRAASVHFSKIHITNTYAIDEIDDYRNEDFDDSEWAQVLAEVARMLKESQRLAA